MDCWWAGFYSELLSRMEIGVGMAVEGKEEMRFLTS